MGFYFNPICLWAYIVVHDMNFFMPSKVVNSFVSLFNLTIAIPYGLSGLI